MVGYVTLEQCQDFYIGKITPDKKYTLFYKYKDENKLCAGGRNEKKQLVRAFKIHGGSAVIAVKSKKQKRNVVAAPVLNGRVRLYGWFGVPDYTLYYSCYINLADLTSVMLESAYNHFEHEMVIRDFQIENYTAYKELYFIGAEGYGNVLFYDYLPHDDYEWDYTYGDSDHYGHSEIHILENEPAPLMLSELMTDIFGYRSEGAPTWVKNMKSGYPRLISGQTFTITMQCGTSPLTTGGGYNIELGNNITGSGYDAFSNTVKVAVTLLGVMVNENQIDVSIRINGAINGKLVRDDNTEIPTGHIGVFERLNKDNIFSFKSNVSTNDFKLVDDAGNVECPVTFHYRNEWNTSGILGSPYLEDEPSILYLDILGVTHKYTKSMSTGALTHDSGATLLLPLYDARVVDKNSGQMKIVYESPAGINVLYRSGGMPIDAEQLTYRKIVPYNWQNDGWLFTKEDTCPGGKSADSWGTWVYDIISNGNIELLVCWRWDASSQIKNYLNFFNSLLNLEPNDLWLKKIISNLLGLQGTINKYFVLDSYVIAARSPREKHWTTVDPNVNLPQKPLTWRVQTVW